MLCGWAWVRLYDKRKVSYTLTIALVKYICKMSNHLLNKLSYDLSDSHLNPKHMDCNSVFGTEIVLRLFP